MTSKHAPVASGALTTDAARWPAHDDLLRYRADFPIFERVNYLNSCSLGALSTRAMAGINEYMRLWGSMGASAWYEIWLGRLAALRAEIAALLNAGPDEIAIGPSISSAVSVDRLLPRLSHAPEGRHDRVGLPHTGAPVAGQAAARGRGGDRAPRAIASAWTWRRWRRQWTSARRW